MVFLLQQVTDGCALSSGCQCGTVVLVPHLREPCADCPGKAAPSHPAQSRAPCMSPLHHPLPHRALGGLCPAGPAAPGLGSPTSRHSCFSSIALGKAAGRMQGRQEVSELQGTRVGGDQRAVEAWGRERNCGFLCCSEPGAQLEPGRRARGSAWSHTCTAREVVSAHLLESSHQTPTEHSLQARWSLWEGVLLERATLMLIKTLILTCKLHLHWTQEILKQIQSAKAVKEEVKRVHLFEANTSYLCFIRGFLLSWHCVIYIFSLTRCPLLCKIYTSIERLWNTQGNNFSVDWVLNGKTSLNAILQIRRSPAF